VLINLRQKFHFGMVAISLAAMVVVFCGHAAAAQIDRPAGDAGISAAICPIVFPLDAFPTEQGIRYFFYGNAFFINDDGYLITAAHVVSSFRNGGLPHVLVGPPGGPRRVVEAAIVAVDWEHDVAVLRATPNPFHGSHDVAFLPLTAEQPSPGDGVLAVSLRPPDLHNSHTSQEPVEERSSGQVINYQFTLGDTDNADSELLLFNQRVAPGQSGSPVVSADSRAVVGIVVGQWQRPTVVRFANSAQPLLMLSPGAALRIHYAISLLRQHGISWHTDLAASASAASAGSSAASEPAAPQASGFSPPVPLSVVATPYPPQALFGGEVVLSALIDAGGKLADVDVVHGGGPFLEPVLDAVRTWTFSPAQRDGNAVESRVTIVFQFPQSFLPKVVSAERDHSYDEPPADSPAHGALPVVTVEPNYPVNTVMEGTVALYDVVDTHGEIVSTRILRDVPPLTDATVAASHLWRFVPGEQAGSATDSAVILVVTFRRPGR
jgi:hypothetical protein